MFSFLDIIEFLKTNVISIIGIIFAVLIASYYHNKRTKICCYSIKSTKVIENLDSKFENIEMYHLKSGSKDEKITDLTVTKILFWNDGKDTIRSTDIATAKPLRIKIKEGYNILDVKSSAKTDINLITVDPAGDGSYLVNFEYIEKNDGAIIQILHTGKSNLDIEFEGKLIGCKLERRSLIINKKMVISLNLPLIRTTQLKLDYTKSYLYLMLSMWIFMIPISYLSIKSIDMIIDMIISTILMLILLITMIYLYSKRKVPKGFEKFEESI
jgi:hypothetical protein